MAELLRGSLAHFPPAQILALLGAHRHTGALEVVSASRGAATVCFRDGVIVWAQRVGTTAPAAEAVIDLFTWDGGDFTFRGELAMPADATQVALDVAPLIEAGLRRAAEANDGNVRYRVVDDPPVNAAINLSGDEFKILMRVGSGRSVSEIATEAKVAAADARQALSKLEQAGLVTREVPTQPVKIEPAEPRPAKSGPLPKLARPKRVNASLTMAGANPAVFPLLDDEQTIGRTDANAVAIADGSVSSRHAVIRRTDHGFMVEDLGSRNGTWVNGERVTEARLLQDKDLLRVGKVVLTYNVAVEKSRLDTTHPSRRTKH